MEELKYNIFNLITNISNKIDKEEINIGYAEGYIVALEDVMMNIKSIELKQRKEGV